MSKTLSTLLALSLGLTLAHGAAAQDAAPAEPAPAADSANPEGLSMGQPEQDPNAPGAMRVEATFEEWEQRCVNGEDGNSTCQLYQLLQDGEGNNVAEISLFNLPEGQQAAAGATIIAPLETLLTANLTLRVDQGQQKVYPFTWCSTVGCVARVGFTQAEVDALKAGSVAQLTIVPVVAPDEKVVLDVSLAGFTDGYEALVAANAE